MISAEEEIRLNALDDKTDLALWDAVEVAVERARKMGFDVENLIDRIRDEWVMQEDAE